MYTGSFCCNLGANLLSYPPPPPNFLAEYDRSLHADQQSQYNLYLKMKGSVRKLDLKNYKFFAF